jgi:hypothetical protein
LIEADHEEEALEKAMDIGIREQDTFYNQQQKLVQWKFINVSELHILGGLLDGAELYSRIQETDNADRYIELTNNKAAHIRKHNNHQMMNIH